MRNAPYLVALAGTLFFVSTQIAFAEENKSSESKTDNLLIRPVEPAKEAIEKTSKYADDVMSKALEDELLRSITELTIAGRPNPYFVSYLGTASQAFNIYGSFGALDQVTDGRYRSVSADVRVGDYKLDSSGGRMFNFGGQGRRGTCSLDDNYDAIRHELWLGTDYGYKRAIEGLDNKRAVLQQKKVEDLPESMSKADAVISMQPASELQIAKDNWKNTIREVSGVFREYPAVVDSTVALISRGKTRWFANSEGSLNRESDSAILLGISANGQAADGMRVSDFEIFSARNEGAIPDKVELERKAREVAKRVKSLTEAKTIEDYRGPILFEKQAAAELFAQALAPRLTNKTQSINSVFSRFEPVNDKIGRRILPTFLSVIDDPLAREFNGQQLTGGYLVDDEGVKAQKITLVENGYLKTFCSGRTPSREVKTSNGHWIDGSATVSQLFINSNKTESVESLKKKLLELGKEEGLDYVLIARHISTGLLNSLTPGSIAMSMGAEGNAIHITEPTLLYKVSVKDSKEELVRGAKFTRLSHRLFRDIMAVGDDSAAYVVKFPTYYSTTGNSVVTPSVLISEVDVERESHENDMPMLLKNSFFGEEKKKASTK